MLRLQLDMPVVNVGCGRWFMFCSSNMHAFRRKSSGVSGRLGMQPQWSCWLHILSRQHPTAVVCLL